MQNKIKLAIIAALTLLLFSCGDSGTNQGPEITADYFSMSKGDYFVYLRYYNESNGGEQLAWRDSLSVTDVQNKDNFMLSTVDYYCDNLDEDEPGYYKYDNPMIQKCNKEQIFFTGREILSKLGHVFHFFSKSGIAPKQYKSLQEELIKIADLRNKSFNFFSDDFEMKDIEADSYRIKGLPSDPGKITLDISYNAEVATQTNEKYIDPTNSKSLDAVISKITHKFKLRFKFENEVEGLKELPLDDSIIKYEEYYVFADGIGYVKRYSTNGPLVLNSTIAGKKIEVTILSTPGYTDKLVKYKKAK